MLSFIQPTPFIPWSINSTESSGSNHSIDSFLPPFFLSIVHLFGIFSLVIPVLVLGLSNTTVTNNLLGMVGVVLFGLPCRTENRCVGFHDRHAFFVLSYPWMSWNSKQNGNRGFQVQWCYYLRGLRRKNPISGCTWLFRNLARSQCHDNSVLSRVFMDFLFILRGGFWRHTPNTNNPSHNHQSGIRTNNCMNVQECMFNTACLVSSPSNWQTHCKHENMKKHAKPCGSKFGIWMEQCSICLGDFLKFTIWREKVETWVCKPDAVRISCLLILIKSVKVAENWNI